MAYTDKDFPTKKALREAVAAYNAGTGRPVTVYQPFLGTVPENGRITVEGPHYPRPHTWYATVELADGVVVKVK